MRSRPEDPPLNMTPMIDVVFQLIIFFVCTAEMDRSRLDESVKLAMSPHARPVETKDPREINIDVDKQGRISISRIYMSEAYLKQVLRKAVAESGQTTPVVIRGDGTVKHESIRRVMDACAYAGLWKVKFSAIKERAQ